MPPSKAPSVSLPDKYRYNQRPIERVALLMALKKDKQKVIGEDMTDEQIKRFLETELQAHQDADFHTLLRAYRSLRSYDFKRFLSYFKAEGRDQNATNEKGQSLRDIISTHKESDVYLKML